MPKTTAVFRCFLCWFSKIIDKIVFFLNLGLPLFFEALRTKNPIFIVFCHPFLLFFLSLFPWSGAEILETIKTDMRCVWSGVVSMMFACSFAHLVCLSGKPTCQQSLPPGSPAVARRQKQTHKLFRCPYRRERLRVFKSLCYRKTLGIQAGFSPETGLCKDVFCAFSRRTPNLKKFV